MRKVHLLPNVITLANAFCGLLAICKGIDALTLGGSDPAAFASNMSTACWLVFLAQVFDALDGKVARMVGGASAFGAQLDSFSDMLTFGVAPALLAKVLVEHEWPHYFDTAINPRLTFIAAVIFAVMAILRLARFNLENDPDPEAHRAFKGLPSPAAAAAMCGTMLFYLFLRYPEQQTSGGLRTPLGDLLRFVPDVHASTGLGWFLPAIALLLPFLGFLMVSRLRFVHMFSALTGRGQFFTLVGFVVAAVTLYALQELALFVVCNGYVLVGLVLALRRRPASPAGAHE